MGHVKSFDCPSYVTPRQFVIEIVWGAVWGPDPPQHTYPIAGRVGKVDIIFRIRPGVGVGVGVGVDWGPGV